jgi:hypothetical protein
MVTEEFQIFKCSKQTFPSLEGKTKKPYSTSLEKSGSKAPMTASP